MANDRSAAKNASARGSTGTDYRRIAGWGLGGVCDVGHAPPHPPLRPVHIPPPTPPTIASALSILPPCMIHLRRVLLLSLHSPAVFARLHSSCGPSTPVFQYQHCLCSTAIRLQNSCQARFSSSLSLASALILLLLSQSPLLCSKQPPVCCYFVPKKPDHPTSRQPCQSAQPKHTHRHNGRLLH